MSSIEYLAKSKICFTFKPDNGQVSLKISILKATKISVITFPSYVPWKIWHGFAWKEKKTQIVIYKAKKNVLLV